MRFVSRFYCWLVSVCLGLSASCLAQPATVTPTIAPPADTTTRWLNCRDHFMAPSAYDHCVLHIRANHLEQGAGIYKQDVGIRKLMHPLPIRDYVGGDEAMALANSYRRVDLAKSSFLTLGGTIFASAIAARYDCIRKECKGAPVG